MTKAASKYTGMATMTPVMQRAMGECLTPMTRRARLAISSVPPVSYSSWPRMMPRAMTMPTLVMVEPKPEAMPEAMPDRGSRAPKPIRMEVPIRARNGLILNLMIISISKAMPRRKMTINIKISSSLLVFLKTYR